jgi:outer membrane protein assembly factor BamD
MTIVRPKLRTALSQWFLILLAATLLTGCFFRKEDPDAGLSTAQQFYDRAFEAMADGDYETAIRYYETLEARFPFSNQARQGQLDLIYTYYRNRQPESVIDAARQFERENPTHPRIDYTLYMRGMALFSGERNWFFKTFDVDLSKRPPKDAREAYSAFAELIRRFPDSRYAPDARQRMIFLRERIARYENHVASYYYERGAYVAALDRASYNVQVFDGAPAIETSLGIMVDSYRNLGMYDLADDAERALLASFPNTRKRDRDVEDSEKPWYQFW